MQRKIAFCVTAAGRAGCGVPWRVVVLDAPRDVVEEVGGNEEAVEGAAAAVEADEGELVG